MRSTDWAHQYYNLQSHYFYTVHLKTPTKIFTNLFFILYPQYPNTDLYIVSTHYSSLFYYFTLIKYSQKIKLMYSTNTSQGKSIYFCQQEEILWQMTFWYQGDVVSPNVTAYRHKTIWFKVCVIWKWVQICFHIYPWQVSTPKY